MDAYAEWSAARAEKRSVDFRSYIHDVSEARYVMRKVSRLINEQAKKLGLEPLLHQALLQTFGTPAGEDVTIGVLADRLDISSALASRLVTQLEKLGFVARRQVSGDKRKTSVSATETGIEILQRIDDAVHRHIVFFQEDLDADQRLAALAIFAFYVGAEPNSEIFEAVLESAAK